MWPGRFLLTCNLEIVTFTWHGIVGFNEFVYVKINALLPGAQVASPLVLWWAPGLAKVPCGLRALVAEVLCSPELRWPKWLVRGVEGVREARGQLWGGRQGGQGLLLNTEI